ncbi:MAG: hypothetical protein EPO26_17040 [Chloroflexota bacterium]|nr:MAG: hypothetical protein EPO26_17040 [Chloroflexota bacterium]
MFALGGTAIGATACARAPIPIANGTVPLATPAPAARPAAAFLLAKTDPPASNFPEPPVRASRAGLLETAIEARVASTTFGGRPVVTATFDGSVPGPTLRARPGDRVPNSPGQPPG